MEAEVNPADVTTKLKGRFCDVVPLHEPTGLMLMPGAVAESPLHPANVATKSTATGAVRRLILFMRHSWE
jgi:hypothetical protein